MRKLLFFSFLLSANLSFCQVMLLFEAETHDKENMAKVAENYFSAVQEVTGDDFAMTMHHKGWSSKSVYFTWWYDDMKDMVEKMERQESMEGKIIEHLTANPSDPELIKKFNSITNAQISSVWEYVPELSLMDDFMSLSKEKRDEMQYRRFQFINVAMNAESAYEDRTKKAYETDKARGVKYHVAVFRNLFGGKDANYLSVIIDENRQEYMKNFLNRMEKRRASEEWGSNNNPWDLKLYNVTKTEEVYKNLNFKVSSK